MSDRLEDDLDQIVFRCFAQGQYWGTERDGQLDPDYKPENPIDRGQAVKLLQSYIDTKIIEARIDELNRTISFFDDEGRESDKVLKAFVSNRLAELRKTL